MYWVPALLSAPASPVLYPVDTVLPSDTQNNPYMEWLQYTLQTTAAHKQAGQYFGSHPGETPADGWTADAPRTLTFLCESHPGSIRKSAHTLFSWILDPDSW